MVYFINLYSEDTVFFSKEIDIIRTGKRLGLEM